MLEEQANCVCGFGRIAVLLHGSNEVSVLVVVPYSPPLRRCVVVHDGPVCARAVSEFIASAEPDDTPCSLGWLRPPPMFGLSVPPLRSAKRRLVKALLCPTQRPIQRHILMEGRSSSAQHGGHYAALSRWPARNVCVASLHRVAHGCPLLLEF